MLAEASKWRLAGGVERLWGWSLRPMVRPFLRHKVPFAIIGSAAVSYYARGYVRPADLDIIISPSDRGVSAAMAALKEVATSVELLRPLEEIASDELRAGFSVVAQTAQGTLDVVGYDLGVEREAIILRSARVFIDRVRVPICSRRDLIALAAHSPRPTDLHHLHLLVDQ